MASACSYCLPPAGADGGLPLTAPPDHLDGRVSNRMRRRASTAWVWLIYAGRACPRAASFSAWLAACSGRDRECTAR